MMLSRPVAFQLKTNRGVHGSRCLGEPFPCSLERLIYLCATSTQIPSCFMVAQSAPLALFLRDNCLSNNKDTLSYTLRIHRIRIYVRIILYMAVIDFLVFGLSWKEAERGSLAFGLIYVAVWVAWPKQVMADHFLYRNTLSVWLTEILVKFWYRVDRNRRDARFMTLWLMPFPPTHTVPKYFLFAGKSGLFLDFSAVKSRRDVDVAINIRNLAKVSFGVLCKFDHMFVCVHI